MQPHRRDRASWTRGLGPALAPAPQWGAELGAKVETEWPFLRKLPLLGCCLLPTPKRDHSC